MTIVAAVTGLVPDFTTQVFSGLEIVLGLGTRAYVFLPWDLKNPAIL